MSEFLLFLIIVSITWTNWYLKGILEAMQAKGKANQ